MRWRYAWKLLYLYFCWRWLNICFQLFFEISLNYAENLLRAFWSEYGLELAAKLLQSRHGLLILFLILTGGLLGWKLLSFDCIGAFNKREMLTISWIWAALQLNALTLNLLIECLGRSSKIMPKSWDLLQTCSIWSTYCLKQLEICFLNEVGREGRPENQVWLKGY